MNGIKIKVCGMTELLQVQQLVEAGVDYAGFILYEKSPRYIGDKIIPGELKKITGIKKVGVFVNEAPENILAAVNDYGLDMVQLHGDESPKLCEALKAKINVVKVFRVGGDENLDELLQPYENAADYFLFDTKAKEYGGTGKKFDWSFLQQANIGKPYFLSGGIGPDDALVLSDFTKPDPHNFFAIDVNSRFETSPGVKDMIKVKDFTRTIRS